MLLAEHIPVDGCQRVVVSGQLFCVSTMKSVPPHDKLSCSAEVLPRILSAVFVEGLVHGNLTSQEALSLGRKVQATLATAPVNADDRPRDRVMQLPAASLCYRYCTASQTSLLNASGA